jgi:hypothetical protein
MNTRLTDKELRRRAKGPAPDSRSNAYQKWRKARIALGLPTRGLFLRERYTPEQLRERRNRYHRRYMKARKAGKQCQ